MKDETERRSDGDFWRRDLIPAKWGPGLELLKLVSRRAAAVVYLAYGLTAPIYLLMPEGARVLSSSAPRLGLHGAASSVIYLLMGVSAISGCAAAWGWWTKRMTLALGAGALALSAGTALNQLGHAHSPNGEIRGSAPSIFWFFYGAHRAHRDGVHYAGPARTTCATVRTT